MVENISMLASTLAPLWIYLMRLSGKEPVKSVCNGETKRGRRLGELSVHFIQACESDVLLLVYQ